MQVYVSGSNMFEIARLVLDQATALGRRVAVLVHVGKGVHLIAHSSDPSTSSEHGKQLVAVDIDSHARMEHIVKQVGVGIQQVDDHPEFGPTVPVVVIGYAMVGRCASVRSEHRVITHIIAAYKNGRTTAAVHQMLMRGAGRTREVRSSALCSMQLCAPVVASERWLADPPDLRGIDSLSCRCTCLAQLPSCWMWVLGILITTACSP